MKLINKTIKKTIIETLEIGDEEYERITEIIDDDINTYWVGERVCDEDEDGYIDDEDLEQQYEKYIREAKLKRVLKE